jgi:hypothetical protein
MCIHQGVILSFKRVASVGAVLAVSGLLLLPGSGVAQIVALYDGDTTASIDFGSQAGMNSWNVLGQNQLMQQWFWYRTDGGVAHSIDQIGGLTYNTYGQNNFVSATYANAQLSITVQYLLSDQGTGSADMTENISVVNLSGVAITNFNLFEYSNFNLQQSGQNTVTVFGDLVNGYADAYQVNGSTAISESVVSPYATRAEANYTFTTRNNLNTVNGYNLDGTPSAGPGDVTWAFQWTASLAASGAGAELDIVKDKNLSVTMVPEPGTTALAVLGGLCLAGWTVRRRST